MKNCNDRVVAGTQSKLSAIMQMDNLQEEAAREELKRIAEEQEANAEPPLEDIMVME